MLQGLAERCCSSGNAKDGDAAAGEASNPDLPEPKASLFELPELGEADDDAIGVVDENLDGNWLVDDKDDDPFDDSVADDLATGIELSSLVGATTALDDDAAGLENDDAASTAIGVPEAGTSFIGEEDTGLDSEHTFVGDESLGIDPIVREEDDGGAEGLDDPTGEHVDPDLFPPLDESEEEDEQDDVALFSEIALDASESQDEG